MALSRPRCAIFVRLRSLRGMQRLLHVRLRSPMGGCERYRGNMRHCDFTAVLGAKSREQLFEATVRFARQLGFDFVTSMAVLDRPTEEPEFHFVDNGPAEYFEMSSDRDRCRTDPVMQHCKYSSVPIVWDHDTYAAVGQSAKWEEQAAYGYHTGICVATHLPGGRHFCIGVDRDQALPRCASELANIAAHLQLFAAYSQDVALNVLLPSSDQKQLPRLSARELECLRWTTEGKTAWEVGRILSISEQTAVRHLNNATHKLRCVNKHQAVVCALRLGLLQ
jgi:DNA-binding CsgD family transcriptional regulator